MLSINPPRRDALLSPLPRGLSPWGSLNSPNSNSLYSSAPSYHRLDQLDHSLSSPVSSRAETPNLIPRLRTGRSGSGTTVIESWGSGGGVVLENHGKISPAISPRTYPHSIFGLDSRVGSPRSPPLSRKKGSLALMRLQKSEEDVPMRIRSHKSLEQAHQSESRRTSSYMSPTVENIDDAFFTGAATPEPLNQGNAGGIVRPRSKDGSGNGYIRGPPPLTEEETRRPSTILEDVPDCYTPTPETKGPKAKSILDPQDDDLDGTTAASKSAHGKEELTKCTSSPSTLLRLKYPSSHHATIEIQHREGIRITTGRSGSGNSSGSKISIQVDTDANGGGYTSTIRTGGKRGAMSVTVRPSSSTKSHREGAESPAEDGEEELVVVSPPSTRKSKIKSHRLSQRSEKSEKSEKHRSCTPRHLSINLIDLAGGNGSPIDGEQETSPEMCRKVRKMEKSNDLKRESASGSRIQSAILSGSGDPHWSSILDRPISLQKRTSTTSGCMNNILLPVRRNYSISSMDGDMQMNWMEEGLEEAGDWHAADDQTVTYEHEAARADSPTLRELPQGGRKPRPLSNSNVPVEVALTMGFRGVSGGNPSSVVTLEEPPIPGMVPVLPNGGIGIMGMEGMAGGWI